MRQLFFEVCWAPTQGTASESEIVCHVRNLVVHRVIAGGKKCVERA
ncbi:MAG TPA: hypothetical protein PK156_19225 [Polyangium sp.]|nr:hypothetical protein [Polyangium sp.]